MLNIIIPVPLNVVETTVASSYVVLASHRCLSSVICNKANSDWYIHSLIVTLHEFHRRSSSAMIMVLGMTLSCLHRVVFLQNPCANDL